MYLKLSGPTLCTSQCKPLLAPPQAFTGVNKELNYVLLSLPAIYVL